VTHWAAALVVEPSTHATTFRSLIAAGYPPTPIPLYARRRNVHSVAMTFEGARRGAAASLITVGNLDRRPTRRGCSITASRGWTSRAEDQPRLAFGESNFGLIVGTGSVVGAGWITKVSGSYVSVLCALFDQGRTIGSCAKKLLRDSDLVGGSRRISAEFGFDYKTS
jgi:hypothetical protein